MEDIFHQIRNLFLFLVYDEIVIKNLPASAGDTEDSSLIPWSKKWQPTPAFLSGKFHGQKTLAGYSLHGCKELDKTEHTRAQSIYQIHFWHLLRLSYTFSPLICLYGILHL